MDSEGTILGTVCVPVNQKQPSVTESDGKPQSGLFMAKPLLSDALWNRIQPLLPAHPPRPKGGRPRLSDRAALTGILFVLATGIPNIPDQTPVTAAVRAASII